jgi:hypothetical protein
MRLLCQSLPFERGIFRIHDSTGMVGDVEPRRLDYSSKIDAPVAVSSIMHCNLFNDSVLVSL